jgi:arginyl-tRNA synthetase
LYRHFQQQLAHRVRAYLRERYDIDLPNIVIEQPPKVELGEFALPLSFELAKRLRKPPRKIAEEIVSGISSIPGFERLEVAGAGYINAHLDRAAAASALLQGDEPVEMDGARPPSAGETRDKILVEHTSINPNKAAHIGHLRNAVLGDTFVRLLLAARRAVDVQNYIDNTGVQVADVVVGFRELEHKTKSDIEQLARRDPRFDYLCWDLYARVSQWYQEDKANLARRGETLHAIEQGGNEAAEIAEIISTSVLRRHLETMQRLDIEYDFLPRESEILRLHFWDLAFQQMKDKGVLYLENEGKNKGCWVMRRPGTLSRTFAAGDSAIDPKDLRIDAYPRPGELETLSAVRITHLPSGAVVTSQDAPSEHNNREVAMQLMRATLAEMERKKIEEDQKVIVRSNGTVGYVGKDIAYHLWKFGLLGRDFEYCRFYRYPDQHEVWISSVEGEKDHPHFGSVSAIYNVIDARQAEAQNTVIEALRALGYTSAAEHYTHLSYEMVALTPRCAAELGYQLSEDDWGKAYIEVSGRKGFGVKADDLIDTLIAAARKEVDSRHAELREEERLDIAAQIAIGALRYFMLKFTKPSVIAFDFKEALSFEGETGPYAQYAVVRATNIFRKAGIDPETILSSIDNRQSAIGKAPSPIDHQPSPAADFSPYLNGPSANELWELWLAASKTSYVIEQCIATAEPAYAAKHAFQLAQLFNNFYHRHHILNEPDQGRKHFLLATAAVLRRELLRILDVMGIQVPPVM